MTHLRTYPPTRVSGDRRAGKLSIRPLALALVVGASLLASAGTAAADVSATSPGGELALSTPGPVLAGVASTYTITVTNPTSQVMYGVQTGVQLPGDLNLKGFNPVDACVRSNRPTLPGTGFSCGFGNLNPGASATASFTASAASPGTDTIQLQGSWTGGPGGPGYADALSLAVPVNPGPTDIQVTGSSSTGSPALGSPFTYTFQVKNNGPQAAYGVTFDDPLPASVGLVGVSGASGTCAPNSAANSVHCDIGSLGVGGQVTIVISATAPAAPGAVTDTGTIAMLGPDTHAANNSVGVTVQPR